MNEERLMRLPEVMHRIPYSRAKIYEMIARNEFPAPVKLGGGRASFWRQSEVDRFISEKAIPVKPAAAR